MAEFALDLSRFVTKAQDNTRAVVRKVGIEMFTATVMDTPVGDPDLWKGPAPAGYVGGRLRANWMPSIGNPRPDTSDSIDKTGDKTRARVTSALIRWTEGDLYLMNNLPYATPVEYGWSSQAPQGMVRTNVARFQSFVDGAVRSLPK